jgi:signal transduction histidine kinase
MRRDVERAAASTRLALDAVEGGHRSRAARLLHTRADPALELAAETVLETLRFDVQASEGLAREVRDVRRSATREIAILDVLATIVALGAALIAFRASREHDRLLQRHNALLAERVTDLDRFAGRVAHDILSPLNAVGVALALVARSTDSHSPEHIDRAQRSLLRVKQLVEGLLRFARAGADVDSGSRCPVDVVLTNVAADCQERAREQDITVVVEPCERLEAACTIGVLTSIVQNLVLNAIKYMGNGPTRRVTIRARLVGERVRIEVEDTGPGIPAKIRDRMFQPFVRGEQSTEGLGLGLATVQRLVDAHGGTVDVHSTAGVGTVFRIDLPVAKPVDV